MTSFRNLSYRQKLTLVLTLTSSLALSLAAIAFATYDIVAFRGTMILDLSALARIIGNNSTAALTFHDQKGATEILQALAAKPSIVSACLYTPDGRVFAGYRRDGAWDPAKAGPIEPDGHRFGSGGLVLFRSIVLDQETVGIVRIDSDLRELRARLERYGAVAGVVLFVSALFAFILSSRLQRVVSEPMMRLAQAARTVSAEKNYSIRVARQSGDELGQLTDSFNEMLSQIQARDAALRDAHADLERRVKERTRELHEQVAERRLTEEALRQSEEQFRQAQKMEAVGRLAGGVAHDFNNLLTAILGYGQLMLMRLGKDDPLRNHAEEILKASQRAASLTRQLLAFSRKQVLDPKILDLNAVVMGMDQMLRRLIGEDIVLTCSPGLELGRVKADPGQIDQVLLNLVVNARDAMPSGGKLLIETLDVTLDANYARVHPWVTPGDYVMLAVSDTGCGMDEATQKRIFEPFFTTKEKGLGTGLGLSTVYGIVKQSGGHISVYSEPGHGTTFKIYLPRVQGLAAEPDRFKGASGVVSAGREVILLVEDEETVRQLARDVLRMQGYTVLEAPHGREAALICGRHDGPIDLMVTDVVMPQINGVELASLMARSRPEMRVLFMSGYTESGIIDRGTLRSGTAFLPKPFTPDALLRKVREVLDATPVVQPLHG